jgi:putative OPT family oligopeptide transporter
MAGVPADPAFIAYALIVTAIVFAVAVIANDNLQDLKTGQLVQATPWRQQTALIVGVAAGAVVIPFVLNALNRAFGFEGGPAGIASEPLAAPQATLISALARGVIGGDLRWDLIGVGAVIGVVVILLDAALNGATKGRIKLPPLAVGIGFYLPAAVTSMLVIGAVAGWLYEKTLKGRSFEEVGKRMGVLMASGLIVGESLFGVLNAGVIGATENEAPFAVFGIAETWPEEGGMLAGMLVFALIALGLYRWVRGQSAKV